VIAPTISISREAVCAKTQTIVLYGDGETVAVTAEKDGGRFLLVSGKTIGEPVCLVWPHRHEPKKKI